LTNIAWQLYAMREDAAAQEAFLTQRVYKVVFEKIASRTNPSTSSSYQHKLTDLCGD